MSSMVRTTLASLAAMVAFSGLAFTSSPAFADDSLESGADWDMARAQLIASAPGDMAGAVARWRSLNASASLGFNEYAGFLLAYPGFPEEAKMRLNAEHALDREGIESARIVAFFDRFPPVTNAARAHYALALFAVGRKEAQAVALEAWRGGAMSDVAEASLFSLIAPAIAAQDHDARMDALLWAGATGQAERQLLYVSPTSRPAMMARLAWLKGSDPSTLGIAVSPSLLADPGYLYNKVRTQRAGAGVLLASRPKLSRQPLDQRKWLALMLSVARGSDAGSAVRIAAGIDETYPPGTDVSRLSFQQRDDYTSLVWLGGTKALWNLGDPAAAAPLFERFGKAARSPGTRTKGFYWAGRAWARAGNQAEAARSFEMAAMYPDQFYGLLALERLGRPVPPFSNAPKSAPSTAERRAFNAKPITAAVREVARESDWSTAIRFFKELTEQAESEGDHVLIAEYARQLGRRDLAVILAQGAHNDGYGDFQRVGFPLIPVPQGLDWTMVHAITRQESQFAMNAVSHAGARGLMQLMPGTAREQAGKLGLQYDAQSLTTDAGYNLTLGGTYFDRMRSYFGGSYPLAVAAYNAGAGNVNKWLRANGDPRTGSVDWIDWIERIPLFETRNYVVRVMENAVVYEAMNPQRAVNRGPNPLSQMLGKRTPG